MRRVVCTNRVVPLPRLAPALGGLRITHLSDLHVGLLNPPHRLPELLDTCRRIDGDLIAVTGDLIDYSLDVLDEVVDAMKQLAAPLGVYFVPGNHDYLVDRARFVRRMRHAGLNLLLDETLSLSARGCRIMLGGLDYCRRRDLGRRVHRALPPPEHDAADLRLVLAHHPDAFDSTSQRAIDLTLSGHTHGGQLALSDRRGRKGSIGLGSLAFRYPRGLYQRGACHLHVTTGVGAWFPLRVRCPAEIASLTLVSARELAAVQPAA